MISFLKEPVVPFFAKVDPWVAALATFLLSFGVIMTIRSIERNMSITFPRWMLFNIGDSIALPILAFSISSAFQGYKPGDAWYEKRWLTAGLLVIGFVFAVYLLNGARQTRQATWEQIFAFDEVYHTIIVWPIVLALFGRSLILVIVRRHEVSALEWTGLILGLLIFIGAYAYDMSPAQEAARTRQGVS